MRAESKGSFEKPPEGYAKFWCIRVIDLGTQEGQWKGSTTYNRKIWVQFELPEHMTEFEGQTMPMVISRKYNLKFSQKADLRKDMESWYGKRFNDKDIEASGGFDPEKILGRCGKLQVVYSDDGEYANVGVIIPEDEAGMPKRVHPLVFFDLDNFDKAVYDGMTEKMQDWIAKSPEYQAIAGTAPGTPPPEQEALKITDDDIPF